MAPTKRIILTIILCGATVAALNETSVGICNVKDNEINCCPNYHEVDNNCVVCPAGRWGDNYSLVCPINYYGVLCKEACDCHLEEKTSNMAVYQNRLIHHLHSRLITQSLY